MSGLLQRYSYTVWWNILLITLGSIIFSLALKGIVVHHQFIPGGVFGIGLLIYYVTPVLSAGIWFFLLNIPLFVLGWLYVSRRFFGYSLDAMVITTLAYELIQIDLGIQDQFYAAIAAGAIGGLGCGIVLRSLGSNGGLDVVAVILNQKYNLGIGKFYFVFNSLLFSFGLFIIKIDLIIASLILVFIMSYLIEYTLSIFNNRKLVLIISNQHEDIAHDLMYRLKVGVTFLQGKGAYTGKDKNIIMTITNNIMLKQLEQAVFSVDQSAIFIVENTFSVLGTSFTQRKIY